jgi:23S rRNA pseudouridine2604 synthase
MCEHFDYTVRRLQRVRIMHIRLASLPVGKWRNLTPAEIKPLLAQPPSRPRLSLRKAADRGD